MSKITTFLRRLFREPAGVLVTIKYDGQEPRTFVQQRVSVEEMPPIGMFDGHGIVVAWEISPWP